MVRKIQSAALLAALGVVVFCVQASPATAQGADEATQRKLEELSRQNEELQKRVEALEKSPAGMTAGGFEFKPYGWVQVDAAYDTSRTAYGDLMFFVYPDGVSRAGKQELNFSARGTRLGAHINAPEGGNKKLTGRVEFDFSDDLSPNKYTLRVRLAYMDVAWGDGWSLRFGQDWDTYSNFHPSTVDSTILGFQGHPYGRHPQIRLTKETKLGASTSLTAKVAIQHGRNGGDADGDGVPDENAAASPNLHGSLALKTKLLTDRPTLFTFSAAYGREEVEGAVAHPGTYRSLLLHGGLQLPISKSLTLSGEGWTGENIDNYLAGVGQGVNAASGTTVSALGGWVQGVWQPVKAIKTGVGYGVDDPEDAELGGNARTFNDRVFANVFYYITDKATIGFEYSHIRTDYALTPDMGNNRFHLGVMYTF
ncbi:MAG: hypothetical protein LBT74_04445 [Acidobacteriota bacterium]|jgi:hypothetical protein|nr:hypothetical protein [Acidobacteriota bacterium]